MYLLFYNFLDKDTTTIHRYGSGPCASIVTHTGILICLFSNILLLSYGDVSRVIAIVICEILFSQHSLKFSIVIAITLSL